MSYGFEAYIDESGCEGFKFRPRPRPGSPEWFVLSAIIWRTDDRSRILKRLDKAKAIIAPNRKHMHFIDLSHDQKVAWVHEIAILGGITSVNVLINKPALNRRDIFQQKDRLYFYATRLLLERVSWFCRDHHRAQPAADGSARITFSKRKNMSYDELRAYLGVLRGQHHANEWLDMLTNDVRIDWSVVKATQIKVKAHGDAWGLQVADAVCGGLRAALEYSPYTFTEHRFAKMLRPTVYARPIPAMPENLNHTSYGLKFFPANPNDAPDPRPRYGWVRRYYMP